MKKLIFIPTWQCNLKCSYCDYKCSNLEGIYTATGKHPGYILEAFGKELTIGKELTALEWAEQLKRFDPFILEMTGGEPTIYTELPELLKRLPIDSKWAITSNTLLSDNIHLLPTYNCKDWTASYHYHSDAKFIDNVHYLRMCGVPTRITIVLTPENHKTLKDKVRMFVYEQMGVNIHPMLKPGFAWSDHQDIYDEIKSFADTNPFVKFIDDVPDSWKAEKHLYCQAGTEEYFVLMPDGTVLRCYSDLLRYESTMNIKDFVPNVGNKECGKECMFPCDKQIARATVSEKGC